MGRVVKFLFKELWMSAFKMRMIHCSSQVSIAALFPLPSLFLMLIESIGYYLNGQVFNVTSQILLNNLIKVDEVSSTVSFDFYFRVYWIDPRLRMDAFWTALKNPMIAANGIDLTQVIGIQNINGTQPGE
jgi:hypothetical protein